ncbi:MAG: hypothetical protein RLZZ516_1521 [Cyanobacteriota bacterium]|jgi:hypothetical protein
MEKEQRTRLQKATQDARRLLEEEFRSQLLQTYDIDVEKVRWAEEPGAHLQAEQRLIREKLIAWIEHKEAQINDRKEALLLALREMAFTALNRFVALKLMEARELVRPCVSGGLESAGFLEFTAVAQGLLADQESSYRLFLETIFEDVSRELRALFDPRDPASLLWPRRTALMELLETLNTPELAFVWRQDETIGWIYQYFNGNEVKEMRDAAKGGAPRNSRELAVRNQFFTPRYVVEFLTDNTLGRIWYEMRQGDTRLTNRCSYLLRRPKEIWLQPGEVATAVLVEDEGLSQVDVLQQPVHIAYRPLKDPREIRILDPACGSMHFGLYAFDLYLEIYAEAWEITKASEEQAQQSEAFAPFVAYVANFANKAAFMRDVPRLILLHNIHGIDIDPRATQIARLTLWLRAQRSWQEQQLEVADRPPITRSNVVCAEPMPGERELLADFVDRQFPEPERGLVQQLLEAIFEKMQLAGEAGTLLKIEEEIRDAIDEARRAWQKLAVQQRDLFSASELAALGQVGSSLNTDLQNLTKDFWINIEERIYKALGHYAEQTDNNDGFQRQLFTEDAAQGFAFIDVCRKRYDAVLMNPPFGDPVNKKSNWVKRYKDQQLDLYCLFVSHAIDILHPDGLVGCLTSSSFKTYVDYQRFRSAYMVSGGLLGFADLGWGVLDNAYVETAAYALARMPRTMRLAPFVDLREAENKETALAKAISGGNCGDSVYWRDPTSFGLLPDSPLIYWWERERFNYFASLPTLGEKCEQIGKGAGPHAIFYRLRWEVPANEIGLNKRWAPYANGGPYSPFRRDDNLLLEWASNGSLVKSYILEKYPYLKGNTEWNIQLEGYYGKPGITYGKKTTNFSAQPLTEGSIFSFEGIGVFPASRKSFEWILACLNSRYASWFLNMTCGLHKNPPYLKKLPLPLLDDQARDQLSRLFKRGWESQYSISCSRETSPVFRAPFWAMSRSKGLSRESHVSNQLAGILSDVDNLILSALGIAEDDIIQGQNIETEDDLEKEELAAGAASEGLHGGMADLMSYSLGCVFGRWNIQVEADGNDSLVFPDPFKPLPICPPGQLQNIEGLPACPGDVSSSYPIGIQWDGILVDDPNHPLDLASKVDEVIEIICSVQEGDSTPEAVIHEACENFGVRSLREYFRMTTGFFADHLKRYSKSRRQAPIYWQLSAGGGSYSFWLYYHRFTQDTLYRVLRDFVEPRIKQAEREQFELESQGALSGDAATRLQEAQTLLQDLRILKSELDLVAPLWNPNLNDGVIINHAILWRITPYTPWQKKCKECWDKLVKGDYDWAHLAFHLWPERVIPKCTNDRSLAIAHGLEERLWQETNNRNWLPRQLSEADLQALIAQHTKPAVKNALERFLAAPLPVAPTRTRASRSTRSTGSSAPRRPRGTAAVLDAEATRQTLFALAAAPAEGLSKNDIASVLDVEAATLTPVIKQLKASEQIEQLGAAKGTKYRLTEAGRSAINEMETD